MDTQNRLDAWQNIVTGIGGPADKSSGFIFTPLMISNDWTSLEYLYEEDHLSAKIIDAPVDDAFRRGWSIETSDDETLSEAITDECDRLGIEQATSEAMRWARLYGGAAVFIGADDGQSVSEPLNVQAVRSVNFVASYDRTELTPHSYYTNPLSANFGKPEKYRLHPRDATRQVGMIVDATRMVILRGRETTKNQRAQNNSWGQSELIRVFQSLKHYGGALASVLALIADSSQGIYTIKGLAKIIQSGNTVALQTRMQAIQEIRSVINAVILDEGESYQRVATPLTELGNLIDRYKLDVCSAAEMPASKLFGQAPAGLNATGESDMRLWYDRVARLQRKTVKPAFERIIDAILHSRTGPTRGVVPQKWAVKFASPWAPTEKEQAEIAGLNATSDAVYVDLKVLTPYQVARARFSGGEERAIVLTPAELNALHANEIITLGTGESETGAPGTTAGILSGAPAPIPVATQSATQATLDDEAAPVDPYVGARTLAKKMTVSAVTRCEHGKVNRCQLCGIERTRDFETGPDGQPVWTVAWKAIGDLDTEPALEVNPEDP